MRRLLFIVLLLVGCVSAQATRVGAAVTAISSTVGGTAAMTISCSSGQQMVVTAGQTNGTVGNMTIADSTGGSNTWTKDYDQKEAVTTNIQFVVWRSNLAANITTVTVSGASWKAAKAQCLTGLASVPTVVISTIKATASSTSWATNSAVVGATSYGICIVANLVDTRTFTISTSGYTLTSVDQVNDGDRFGFADNINLASGTDSCAGTNSLATATASAFLAITTAGGAVAPSGFNKRQKLDRIDP